MVSTVRAQRIAARIQEELSDILLRESSDPRLAGVSVTDVKVDRELEFASIYVSALEGSERAQDILDGLKHAQGFLRSELAQRIDLRVFPRLRFYWDPTFEKAERLESLFAMLDAEKKPEDLSPLETEADSSSGYEEEPPDSSEAETDE